MLPIFEDYRKMLNDFNVDLSEYDNDKLWIDNLIIKGFDRNGKERKILRLHVEGEWDNLHYECSNYYKIKTKNGEKIKIISKPSNEELETWEETYKRLEKSIREREREY